jgi:sec-independent protein translocase protein TatA
MFGFGVPELIIILVVLLLICGPAKLPQLGAALG